MVKIFQKMSVLLYFYQINAELVSIGVFFQKKMCLTELHLANNNSQFRLFFESLSC